MLLTTKRKILLPESLVFKFLVLKKTANEIRYTKFIKINLILKGFYHLYMEYADENVFRSYTRMTTCTYDYIKEAIEPECYYTKNRKMKN